jgi:deoxyadenosine/deoxycytidine kinase
LAPSTRTIPWKRRIHLHANICGGKSTIQDHLERHYRVPVFKEPVGDIGELLEKYYSDIATYAAELQYTFVRHHRRVFQSMQQHAGVTERDQFSAVYAFGKMLVDKGDITAEQQAEMERWVRDDLRDADLTRMLVVYVDVSPEICFERIQHRQQVGDNKISLDYLRDVAAYMEVMLRILHNAGVRVVRIDGTARIGDVVDRVYSYLCGDDDNEGGGVGGTDVNSNGGI